MYIIFFHYVYIKSFNIKFSKHQTWSWSNLRVALSPLQSHEKRIQVAQDEEHSVNRGVHWSSWSFKTQPYKTRRMLMAGRTRRDEQKLRSDASVHRIGAIHPGGNAPNRFYEVPLRHYLLSTHSFAAAAAGFEFSR